MKTRGKVFISYRRDGGAELARNIRDALQKRRFDVFMDVEDLRGGSFNKALYQQIEAATDVVAVLTPGSLDRCFDSPDDWFRLELAHALKQQKNVVPILHRGFTWPDRSLPDDLAVLAEQNGMSSSHELFEASMDRLAERLLVGWAPRPVERTRMLIVAASVVLVAAALGLIWWQKSGANAQAPPPDRKSAGSTQLGTSPFVDGSHWTLCWSANQVRALPPGVWDAIKGSAYGIRSCPEGVGFPLTVLNRKDTTLTFEVAGGRTIVLQEASVELVTAVETALGPKQVIRIVPVEENKTRSK